MADREQVSIPLHMLTRTCIGFGILVAALVGVIVFLVYYQDCKGCQQELNECRVQLSRESMSCKYEKEDIRVVKLNCKNVNVRLNKNILTTVN